MAKRRKKSLLLIWLLVSAVVVNFYVLIHRAKKTIADSFAEKIVLINEEEPFKISYQNLEVSFFNRSFQLNEVLVLPDSISYNSTKAKPHSYASLILAEQFQLIPLLFRRELIIDRIKIDGLEIALKKKGTKENLFKKKAGGKKEKNKPLNKLAINNIELNDYKFSQLTVDLKDTIVNFFGEKLLLKNVLFSRDKQKPTTLSLKLKDLKLTGLNHQFIVSEKKESLSFKRFALDLDKGQLDLVDFNFGNEKKSRKIALKAPFNMPVSSFKIPEMSYYGINIDSLTTNKSLIIDSLLITQADFTVIKNTTKPWNKNRVIPLPNQLLSNDKISFWIHKIKLKDAQLNYLEILESKEILIPLHDINLTLENLGTTGELYKNLSDNEMVIDIKGSMFKNIAFTSQFVFKDPINKDLFRFSGRTGPFNFNAFNPIMVPTSNIKFESGKVHGIEFNGHGNGIRTEGEFLMRYEDLNTTVLKRRSRETNKTFSWLAKTMVRKENPKNGKLKTAKMSFKRVPYKGFGNYIFKTIESGMINSVYPLGARKQK